MSRLYYESSATQSAARAPGAGAPPAPNNGISDYLDKVSKLIPSEVVVLYLTLYGFVKVIQPDQTRTIFIWIIFAVGTILTPIYLNGVADADKPKRNHLIVSTIAFIVWAYFITGEILLPTIGLKYNSEVASVILILFSAISSRIPLDK